MGNQEAKDPVAKARKKVAKAQNRYMKAVAKGERQIRNVRATVDERIAKAKAEFEMRASELAEAESAAALKEAQFESPEDTAKSLETPSKRSKRISTPVEAAVAVEAVQVATAPAETDIVAANGSSTSPKRDAKGRFIGAKSAH